MRGRGDRTVGDGGRDIGAGGGAPTGLGCRRAPVLGGSSPGPCYAAAEASAAERRGHSRAPTNSAGARFPPGDARRLGRPAAAAVSEGLRCHCRWRCRLSEVGPDAARPRRGRAASRPPRRPGRGGDWAGTGAGAGAGLGARGRLGAGARARAPTRFLSLLAPARCPGPAAPTTKEARRPPLRRESSSTFASPLAPPARVRLGALSGSRAAETPLLARRGLRRRRRRRLSRNSSPFAPWHKSGGDIGDVCSFGRRPSPPTNNPETLNGFVGSRLRGGERRTRRTAHTPRGRALPVARAALIGPR